MPWTCLFSLASKTTGLGLGLEQSWPWPWPWPLRPLGRPWPWPWPRRLLALALASKNTGLGLGLEHAGLEPIPANNTVYINCCYLFCNHVSVLQSFPYFVAERSVEYTLPKNSAILSSTLTAVNTLLSEISRSLAIGLAQPFGYKTDERTNGHKVS